MPCPVPKKKKHAKKSAASTTISSTTLLPSSLCLLSFGLALLVVGAHELVVLVKPKELPRRPIPIGLHNLFFLPLPLNFRFWLRRWSRRLRPSTVALLPFPLLHHLIPILVR